MTFGQGRAIVILLPPGSFERFEPPFHKLSLRGFYERIGSIRAGQPEQPFKCRLGQLAGGSCCSLGVQQQRI